MMPNLSCCAYIKKNTCYSLFSLQIYGHIYVRKKKQCGKFPPPKLFSKTTTTMVAQLGSSSFQLSAIGLAVGTMTLVTSYFYDPP